jgi:hypothetical protein
MILGQLYRNKKLPESYKHIIGTLKELKNGNDTDISFKASNSLDVLKEDKGMKQIIKYKLRFVCFYYTSIINFYGILSAF